MLLLDACGLLISTLLHAARCLQPCCSTHRHQQLAYFTLPLAAFLLATCCLQPRRFRARAKAVSGKAVSGNRQGGNGKATGCKGFSGKAATSKGKVTNERSLHGKYTTLYGVRLHLRGCHIYFRLHFLDSEPALVRVHTTEYTYIMYSMYMIIKQSFEPTITKKRSLELLFCLMDHTDSHHKITGNPPKNLVNHRCYELWKILVNHSTFQAVYLS